MEKQLIFNRYEINLNLGKSETAIVYRVLDTHTSRTVVLKILPQNHIQSPADYNQFVEEIQQVNGLHHPAIVPIHDYGQHKGYTYLTMAYMSGESLSEYLKMIVPTFEQAAANLERLASAVDTAHANGLVHGDIRPSNIFYDSDYNAYLADFVVGKFPRRSAKLPSSMDMVACMAPERIEKRELTPLTDIYALGVTVFQMLTARRPFDADSPDELMKKHLTKRVPDIMQARDKIPYGMQDILTKAMAKDPADRYQSAGELSRDFHQLFGFEAKATPLEAPTPVEDSVPEITVPEDDYLDSGDAIRASLDDFVGQRLESTDEEDTPQESPSVPTFQNALISDDSEMVEVLEPPPAVDPVPVETGAEEPPPALPPLPPLQDSLVDSDPAEPEESILEFNALNIEDRPLPSLENILTDDAPEEPEPLAQPEEPEPFTPSADEETVDSTSSASPGDIPVFDDFTVPDEGLSPGIDETLVSGFGSQEGETVTNLRDASAEELEQAPEPEPSLDFVPDFSDVFDSGSSDFPIAEELTEREPVRREGGPPIPIWAIAVIGVLVIVVVVVVVVILGVFKGDSVTQPADQNETVVEEIYTAGPTGTVESPPDPVTEDEEEGISEETPTDVEAEATLIPAETVPTADPNIPSGMIMYTCYDGDFDQLCAIDSAGGDPLQLTDLRLTDWYGSFGLNVDQFVFSSQREGQFEIYFQDGDSIIRLTSELGRNYAPEISPDGAKIAFSSSINQSLDIFIMDIDGRNLLQVTTDLYDDTEPTWSPDGTQIAYASNRTGKNEIYVINIDGTGEYQVTDRAVFNPGSRVDWSPDGSLFAFYAGTQGNNEIYIIPADCELCGPDAVTQLTQEGDNKSPSFSPDGNWIVFASARDGDNDIYIMRLDGSDMRQLTFNNRSDYQPRWGP